MENENQNIELSNASIKNDNVLKQFIPEDYIINVIKNPENDEQLSEVFEYLLNSHMSIEITDDIIQRIILYAQNFINPHISILSLNFLKNIKLNDEMIADLFYNSPINHNVIEFLMSPFNEQILFYLDALLQLSNQSYTYLDQNNVLLHLIQNQNADLILYLKSLEFIAQHPSFDDKYALQIQDILNNLYKIENSEISEQILKIQYLLLIFCNSYENLCSIKQTILSLFNPNQPETTTQVMKNILMITKLIKTKFSANFEELYFEIHERVFDSSPLGQYYAIKAVKKMFYHVIDDILTDNLGEFIAYQIDNPAIIQNSIISLKFIAKTLKSPVPPLVYDYLVNNDILQRVFSVIESHEMKLLAKLTRRLADYFDLLDDDNELFGCIDVDVHEEMVEYKENLESQLEMNEMAMEHFRGQEKEEKAQFISEVCTYLSDILSKIDAYHSQDS